jgi:hypothetical protein
MSRSWRIAFFQHARVTSATYTHCGPLTFGVVWTEDIRRMSVLRRITYAANIYDSRDQRGRI